MLLLQPVRRWEKSTLHNNFSNKRVDLLSRDYSTYILLRVGLFSGNYNTYMLICCLCLCIPFGHLQFKISVQFYHMSSVEGKKKVECHN